MITYEDVRPGDTFVRRSTAGHSELRRVLPDGTSELVKRLHDHPETLLPGLPAYRNDETSSH